MIWLGWGPPSFPNNMVLNLKCLDYVLSKKIRFPTLDWGCGDILHIFYTKLHEESIK